MLSSAESVRQTHNVCCIFLSTTSVPNLFYSKKCVTCNGGGARRPAAASLHVICTGTSEDKNSCKKTVLRLSHAERQTDRQTDVVKTAVAF
jgi:hypothetical protein